MIRPWFIKSNIHLQLVSSKPYSGINKSTSDLEKEKELARIAKEASIDKPPTTCCMSGCANCVYIAWAEAVTKKMEASGPEVAKKILQMIDDPNMKAYIEFELRLKGIIK